MLKHNKKRNVGLISEFFAKSIANSFINQNFVNVEKGKEIFKKYFNPSTQLGKEYILFNSLYTTNIKSKELALKLIESVKDKNKILSSKKLDEEKTFLIQEVNHQLKDKDFFERTIEDFRTQASIQVLLNSWRNDCLLEHISNLTALEDNLLEHLTNKKEQVYDESLLEITNNEIDSLVIKIMTEKFNEKFNNVLSEDQRKIISFYVFSNQENNREKLISLLENVKSDTLSLIDMVQKTKYINNTEELNESLSKKLTGVKNMLINEYSTFNKRIIDDNTISFYMNLINMKKELQESNE